MIVITTQYIKAYIVKRQEIYVNQGLKGKYLPISFTVLGDSGLVDIGDINETLIVW